MILEVAILNVRPGSEAAYETAFREASAIIASMPGYISHQLQRCIEVRNRYILLVNWETLEDHTIGFRGSPEYQDRLYDPFRPSTSDQAHDARTGDERSKPIGATAPCRRQP